MGDTPKQKNKEMGDTSMIKVGPVGNNAGIIVWDEEGRSELVQIFVSHGDKVYSLQFQYVENGALVLSERYGQLTGDNFKAVKLNYPSEYLTGIRGWRDNFGITSITFHTNLRTHGPFGQHGSFGHPPNNIKEFCFELGDDHQFGGFHGTAESVITSIGVYIKPTTTLNPVKVETECVYRKAI